MFSIFSTSAFNGENKLAYFSCTHYLTTYIKTDTRLPSCKHSKIIPSHFIFYLKFILTYLTLWYNHYYFQAVFIPKSISTIKWSNCQKFHLCFVFPMLILAARCCHGYLMFWCDLRKHTDVQRHYCCCTCCHAPASRRLQHFVVAGHNILLWQDVTTFERHFAARCRHGSL